LKGLAISETANFLARDRYAARLHTQELLVTELIFAGVFHEFDMDQIAALAVCIDYEPRRGEFAPGRFRLTWRASAR